MAAVLLEIGMVNVEAAFGVAVAVAVAAAAVVQKDIENHKVRKDIHARLAEPWNLRYAFFGSTVVPA